MCTLPTQEVLRLGETEVLEKELKELEELEDLEEEEDFLVNLEVEDLEVFNDLEEEEEEEDFLGDLEVNDFKRMNCLDDQNGLKPFFRSFPHFISLLSPCNDVRTACHFALWQDVTL